MQRFAPLILLFGLVVASGCATTGGPLPPVGVAPVGEDFQVGVASYYSSKFNGRPTASGEAYDEGALTGAHRTLTFGTRVRVTNLANGRSVVVRINDRGPFAAGRVIDLSRQAARELGFLVKGTTRVRVKVLTD